MPRSADTCCRIRGLRRNSRAEGLCLVSWIDMKSLRLRGSQSITRERLRPTVRPLHDRSLCSAAQE